MYFITKVEHALAVVAQDIVRFAKAVAPIFKKIQASESMIEALTNLVDPNAVAAERAAFALLGKVCAALEHLGDAAAANGVNIQLDAQELADIRALAPALTQLAHAAGLIGKTAAAK
jgi:hypothetical protein